jgi:hypothetical protein
MEFVFWVAVVVVGNAVSYCIYAVVDGYVREEQRLKRLAREYDTSHWRA